MVKARSLKDGPKGLYNLNLKFNPKRYDEFKATIKRISELLTTKTKGRSALEAIFVSKNPISAYISDTFRSKPEDFTKENIISEILDFLGYDKSSRATESELKKVYGNINWPDYKLIIGSENYLLAEAEPLNSDLYARNHGVNQVIEWIQNKACTTDLGLATDGVKWILLEYSTEYRKHNEIIDVDLTPFFLEALGFAVEISETEKQERFTKFDAFFSKELIESTLLKKNLEIENYQESISNKFYKEYMRLVFEQQSCLVNSISNITDSEARKRVAQTIIDRLIFIKFIEARGWLNKNEKFLSDLVKQYKDNPTGSFYDSYLKILFFNVLNNPDDEKKKGQFSGIKYLNGGLFSKTKDEEDNPDYSVNDDILFEIIDFLEKYRFESTKLTKIGVTSEEAENIMSPDILGYIFERTANHEYGAYYTPDNVTSFMARGVVYETIIKSINKKLGELGIQPIKELTSLFMGDEIDSNSVIKEIYENIVNIKILDPACGSGAFFMPVIGVLMRTHNLFREKLKLPIDPYKIKKQIIENNIFGVELNQEAAEIAKLRLWLDLISTVDDINDVDLLPNIEYNIISGNSLLGFDLPLVVNDMNNYLTDLGIAQYIDNLKTIYPEVQRINEYSENPTINNILLIKDMLTKIYKRERDPKTAKLVKTIVEKTNSILRTNLNKHFLAYLESGKNSLSLEKLEALNPIHWPLEFHEVMAKGGFDCVLGNPPYIELSKIEYPVKPFKTKSCGNTYALFFERAINLVKNGGNFGYIIPISAICTDRMAPLQDLLINNTSELKISNYDDRPDKIFKGLEHCRSSIIFGVKKPKSQHHSVYSTHYHRWYAEERDRLFKNMKYVEVTALVTPGIIPKIGDQIEIGIIEKINRISKLSNFLYKGVKKVEGTQKLIELSNQKSNIPIIYHNAPQYWIHALDFMPEFKNDRGTNVSQENKVIYATNDSYVKPIIAVLNSSLFYWFFIVNSDCRHLNEREIYSFPFNPDELKTSEKKKLERLVDSLMKDYMKHSKIKETAYKKTGKVVYREFYPKLSKKIIDKIDSVLFNYYGFSEQEKQYISNFDLSFRMGSD